MNWLWVSFVLSKPFSVWCNHSCLSHVTRHLQPTRNRQQFERLFPRLVIIWSIVCLSHSLNTSLCVFVYIRIHQGLEGTSLLSDVMWQLLPSVITAVNLSHLSEKLKGGYLSMHVWIALGRQINTSCSELRAFAAWSARFPYLLE